MNVIRSTDNSGVKRAVKLKQKKFRDLFGLYQAEGERLVFDIDAWNPDLIEEIYVAESYYVAHNSMVFSQKVNIVSDIVFEKLSETEHSQGIMAIVRKQAMQALSATRCLFLDRVRDPGNLGTIIRTAAAFGFTDIVCNDCADVFAPKTVRSAMSGVAVCNFPKASIADIHASGYSVICADMDGESTETFTKRDGKICLVIGNEANGISQEIKRASDTILCIPMQNMESLNASVSAGIMMYILK